MLQPFYEKEEMETVLTAIFEKVCGWTRTELTVKGSLLVEPDDFRTLKDLVERLSSNEPLQYILGEAWFMGMKLEVNRHVLIPRPETEELVDWMLQELRALRKPHPAILDICTGSGCIALAVKKNLPGSDVTALDNSREAIEMAEGNARLLKHEIRFICDDVLDSHHLAAEMYDVIVSNPPYIREDERVDIALRVLNFEPHTALFVPQEDPLIFYKAISDFARVHLKKNGYLFFEINKRFGNEICKLLKEDGYKDVVLRKDLSGSDRFVYAKSPKFEF